MSIASQSLAAALIAVVASSAVAWFLLRRVQTAFEQFQERTNRRLQTMHAELGRLRSEFQSLRTRAEEAERTAASASVPRHPMSGLHLGQRSQALRMLRRGEPTEKIAAALGLAQTEVDLLGKVQRLLAVDAPPKSS